MSAVSIVLLVMVGIAIVLSVWLIAMYTGLVQARNQVKNAWAQIDVQLKRRHDLIPNLVETAKGYMKHERDTLENITKARNLAAQPHGVADQAKAEGELTRAMSSFFVVVENYPDLKANTNFLQIQEELTSTENKIGFARQYFNDETMKFNTNVEQFPSNIVAGMFNFKQGEFFEIEDAAQREVPKVSFS
jgi:LemA protein